jgi:hypothetical protein
MLFPFLGLNCVDPVQEDKEDIRRESSPFCSHTWLYFFTQVTYKNEDSTWYNGSTEEISYSFTPYKVTKLDFWVFEEQCPTQPAYVCETTFVADSMVTSCNQCLGLKGGHDDSITGIWDFDSTKLYFTFNDTTSYNLTYLLSENEDTLFLEEAGKFRPYIKIE